MILTIDIGGTNVKYGLCDDMGGAFFKKGTIQHQKRHKIL